MIDKLYIMLPEFQIRKDYDIKTAWDDFYKSRPDIIEAISKSKEFNFKRALDEALAENPDFNIDEVDMDELFDNFVRGHKEYEWVSNAQSEFSKWFKERKSQYYLGQKIEKLKYDYSRPAHQQKSYRGDNGLARRNNALIDMMWGILTNPDTASKILNPGGFGKQKMAARVVTILDSMTKEELENEGYTIAKILEMSKDSRNLEVLDKLASKAKRKLDPLSPRTQVTLHQQNMTGGKMIGIYANHNANHALMQHTQLALSDKEGAFNLAGVKRTSLHGVKNESGEFISRNTANFLAASVDNVKDNTLHATNQNTFTGDASMLLSRLGYNPTEIAVLMRQPIVMEITRKFFRESRDGKSKDIVIEEVLSSTIKYAGMYENISWANVKNNPFDLETLMKDIMLYKDVATMSQKDRVDFYRRQVAVGLLFQRIMRTGDALSQLVAATRADTQGGAAGPTIADTMIKLQKIDDFRASIASDKSPLINADIIREITFGGEEQGYTIDNLRQNILNSPLPFLQAFYTLGLRQTERVLRQYFPQFTPHFQEVLDGKFEIVDGEPVEVFRGLRRMTKTGKLNVKTINSIYNDLLAYIMSKTEFFGSGLNRSGKVISSAEKRRSMINNFPVYFKQIVNDNEDIAELEFIKRLKVALHNDKNPVDVLVFKNVGQLSPTLRERYMRDWATLLYMDNPKAQELALNLFLYSYFRNGFAFGPSTFIHLTPVAVRDAVNGYISTLRTLLTEPDDFENFIEQYVFNHLDNRNLVPEIPETSITKFANEKGNIKEEVTITINDASTYGDKAAVLRQTKVEDVTIYEFFQFITRRVGGKNIYYRLSDTQGENTAIYTRIEPLGYKNSFLEYEYGKRATEMETVIDKNKKDYDPNADFVAQHMDQGLTDEMLESMPDYSDAYSEEALAQLSSQAYQRVYGEPLPSAPSVDSNSFSDIAPEDGYRDANDDEICGGNVIAEL